MIAAQLDWRHRALHLGALSAFAFGKPLLDAINESGFFLLPRSAAPIDIVLIGLIALFAVPALLLGLEQLAGLASERFRDGLHLAIVFGLFALLFVQLMGSVGVREPKWVVLLSLLVAAAATYAYARSTFLPTTLDVLSPLPLLFLVMFLFFSPSRGLWLPGSEPAVADASASQEPPIVFLILDEFPTGSLLEAPGRIDQSLYPNFARLGREATWYENATTVADQTERAIPAILTGQRQDSDADGDGMPVARAHPESIFTLLGDSYDIDAIETVTQLCPRGTCEREIRDDFAERFGRIVGDLIHYTPAAVLPTKVHERIFGVGSDISPLPPDTPTELFDRLGDDIEAEPGQMDFLHAGNLPHKPWTMVPSLQRYTDPAEVDDALDHEDFAEAPQVEFDDRKRHLYEVGAADRLVGNLIEKLKSDRAWDRSPVRRGRRPRDQLPPGHRPAARVRGEPGPDRLRADVREAARPAAGRPDPAAVQTIDVVPIIADALGVEIPWEVDGTLPGERSDQGISIVNYKGNVLEATLPGLIERNDNFVTVQSRWLSRGQGWDALIDSGPGGHLIGRAVPERLPDAEGEADVILSGDPDDPDTVDAVVAGSLRGVPVDKPIAIEVNGRIAAMTQSVATPDGVRYEAVLPPRVYLGPVEGVRVLRGFPGPKFELLGEG